MAKLIKHQGSYLKNNLPLSVIKKTAHYIQNNLIYYGTMEITVVNETVGSR